MSSQLLVTAVGEDRPGIVSRITEVLLSHGANLEESRMAVLGGEFAAIMLVTGGADKIDAIQTDLSGLEKDGIQVNTKLTRRLDMERYKGYTLCEISLRGADHEGIAHHLSRRLKDRDINFQSVHTEVIGAPVTGSPLFCMDATIMVPSKTSLENLRAELEEIATQEMVEIELTVTAEGTRVGAGA